jgi:hypothetical protein
MVALASYLVRAQSVISQNTGRRPGLSSAHYRLGHTTRALRRWLAALIGLLYFTPLLFGQITVEVLFEQDQYLAGEQCIAAVRITNFSGQTLHLGADPGWLDLLVETDSKTSVEKLGEPPIIEPFDVPNSAKGTRRVDIAPCFNLRRPGRYHVTATVRIPASGATVSSKSRSLSIIAGTKLWEQSFGIPTTQGAGADGVEVRKYALVQTASQKLNRIYVRITDSQEAKIHRVFPLGPVTSFSRPEAQVDRQGNLHVLFQSGARAFGYNVIRPDGEMVVREIHQYSTTRPVLRADEDGNPVVKGGTRLATSADLPRPAETQPTEPKFLPAPRGPASTGESPKP